MTNDQNRLICTALAGYEVQVSPAGKHVIVTDEGVREMPDFEVCAEETLSTAEALCRSRGLDLTVTQTPNLAYAAWIGSRFAKRPTVTAALARCLLQIAEGE